MPDSSADRDPLERLAEEFVARFRAGQRPSLTEYAERYPELAEPIRDLFPALVEMEQLKPATGEHTGAFTPAAEPSDPVRVGEFRILRRVGQGGMGVVFEAVQESLGRHVALKLLPAEALLDPKRLERFRREAKAAARLHHTNIVPVFGVGEADGRHFYAMQFIAGHPLDAVIDEVKRLKGKVHALPAAPREVSEVAAALVTGTFARTAPPVIGAGESSGAATLAHDAPSDHLAPVPAPAPADSSPALSGTISEGGKRYWGTVARIGAQVADALAYAHGQGILHRDIKPANLLLDLRGTVWVADFGLAKSADADDLTHAGDIVGTLRYMAPERFDGQGDHRADVYALGLTLYELLTLTPAFSTENRAKLVEQVVAASPPSPRSINPAIPRDLETIVLKAIARDPAMRYPSASELADDLRRFTEDRPIRARRASSAEQAWRWCRRNPAVASLMAAVLVVFAAGAGVASFFAVRADAERTRATDREAEAVAAKTDAITTAERLRLKNYAASMNLIQVAWDANNVGRVIELLELQKPQAGQPDLRGFEWHYWNRLCRADLSTVQVPGKMTHHCPVLSPDGSHFAAVVQEGGRLEVRLWDTVTGRETIRLPGPALPRNLDETWGKLAFSPDGTRLAAFLNPSGGNSLDSWHNDGELRIWNCADGRELVTKAISAAAIPGANFRFSPDGKNLGAIVARAEPPNFLRQSSDLLVWDAVSGDEKLHLPCPGSAFYGLSFHPDGTHLLTAEWSGPEADPTSNGVYALKILNIVDKKEVRTLPDLVGFTWFLLFSPDGTRFASSTVKKGGGGELRIYDTATLKVISSWNLDTGWDVRLEFSPDGKRVATGGLDSAVNVWDVTTGALTQSCKGHTTRVASIVFDRGDKRLVSADSEGVIKLWDVAPREIRPVRQDEPDVLIVGAVTSDLSRAAICNSRITAPQPGAPAAQGAIRILDQTDREIRRIEVAEVVNSLAFSPDGRWLAGVVISQREMNSRIVVWDVVSGKDPRTLGGLSGKEFSNLTGFVWFSKDGARLVAILRKANLKKGIDESQLKVWDTATWKESCSITANRDCFLNADISPDGTWVATVGVSAEGVGQARIWEVATGRVVGALETRASGLNNVDISSDGKQIAVSSTLMKSVQVFDAATRNQLFTLKGHAGPVEGVTYAPDSRRIATWVSTQGGDQIIKLWDATTGEEVLTLRHEAGAGAFPCGFNSDGTRLFSLNRFYRRTETGLRVWDATPFSQDK